MLIHNFESIVECTFIVFVEEVDGCVVKLESCLLGGLEGSVITNGLLCWFIWFGFLLVDFLVVHGCDVGH